MLKINKIKSVYSGVVLAVSDVSLSVDDGDIVALIGSNGSGKSTTLKSISGVLATEDGEVTEGMIEFNERRIDRLNPERIARLGICHVLQERSIFAHLTTEENLLMGAYLRRDRQQIKEDITLIYGYFPQLQSLRQRRSGYLSGGEQQMLVIGRAFMARPRLMLLDEPSLGIAPGVIRNIYENLKKINKEQGIAILIAEQNTPAALSIASYGYLLRNGSLADEGPAAQLANEQAIKANYFGADDGAFTSRHHD
ncbi:ABC transporter ATP-binding protein [Chloroflexota bacterium]